MKRYGVGQRVKVTATEAYGICDRLTGGTNGLPAGAKIVVAIIKEWYDYETGQRYVGRDDDGHEYFFGEFYVKIESA